MAEWWFLKANHYLSNKFHLMYVFPLILVGMEAHSSLVNHFPANGLWKLWLWESLCFWRPLQYSDKEIQDSFCLINWFLRRLLGHMEILCWFTRGRGNMEAGEGFFLCSLGSIQLMSGCHIAKISCRGKGGCLAECLLTSTVLSQGKGLGHLLRGRG